MKLHHLLTCILFWTGCLAEPSAPEGKPMPDHGKIILTIPRDPVADEPVNLSVTIGVLPRGARIVLRSDRGELLGSISPFGRASNRPHVSYRMPVPVEEIINRKLTLNFSLEEADKKHVRVPTDTEITEIKLLLGPRRPD